MAESEEQKRNVSQFEYDPVSPKEVFGYNLGALPGAFFGGFMGQIQAFYYRWMGLDWGYIVIAQILFAVWNAINDPIFGLIMNKPRTKQGRYIPWIKWLAPFFSISFIFVFMPPDAWRSQLFPENQNPYMPILFIWYLGSQAAYDTFFTIMYCAHVALLPQMTMATTERTKLAVIYGILALVGGLGSGLLPVAFLTPPTPESIMNLRIFVIIFGTAALLPWYGVVGLVKERKEFLPNEDIGFIQAFRYVFQNPSARIYIIYDGITVGILNILLTGITFMFSYLMGLGLSPSEYGVQDWDIIDALPVLVMMLAGGVIGVIVQLQIPKKKDIKTALQVGLTSMAVGLFIAFLGAIPSPGAPEDKWYPPNNIYLLGLGLGIGLFGLVSDFIYHNPMRSDTIDYDEYLTGERHEGIYAGIGAIFSKPMISVALAIVPAVMGIYGLLPANATDPSDLTLIARAGYPNAILGVAVVCLLIPSILAAIGAVVWLFYPLDRKALDELHVILEEMHEKKRAERLDKDGLSKFVKK